MSRVYVVYTERILFIKPNCGITINQHPYEVAKSPHNSIFVDSMKMRLLSPFRKAIETANDRNVAIGKAIGMAKFIEYAKHPDDAKYARTAFDRFLYKFKDFVPGRHNGKIFAFYGLPAKLGGLGLTLNVYDTLGKQAPIINQALRVVASGGIHANAVYKILSMVTKNNAPRGIVKNEFVSDQLEMFSEHSTETTVNREELLKLFNPDGSLSMRRTLQIASKAGYMSLSQIPKEFEKQHLMKQILSVKPEESKYFNTVKLTKRFSTLWDKLDLYMNIEYKNKAGKQCLPRCPPEKYPQGPLSREEYDEILTLSGLDIFVNMESQRTAMIVDTTDPNFDPEDEY
jgi:hypothetical protein